MVNTLADYYLIVDAIIDKIGAAEKITTAATRSVQQIRLRQSTLNDADYLAWIKIVLPIARACHLVTLIDNADYLSFGAQGVHLTSAKLLTQLQRPISKQYILAASTHDRAQLQHAMRLDIDFVVLGPVKKTATHPDAVALGWEKFAELIKDTSIPVYALGGLTPDDLHTAKQWGACGIAGIRGI